MNRMRFGLCVVGLLSILCIATPVAYADPVTIVFTGVNGSSAGGVYTSPYYGTINGQAVSMICDSFSQRIPAGNTWQATAYSFSNLSGARFFTGSPADAQHNYNAAAWLGEMLLGTLTDFNRNAISFALWDIFTDSAVTLTSPQPQALADAAALWKSNAIAATNSDVNAYANWTVYTPTSTQPTGVSLSGGDIQEFLVRTPESPALAVLGLNLSGLLGLIVLFRRRLVR